MKLAAARRRSTGCPSPGAFAEHLHDTTKARTLFATHYHEMCALSQKRSGIQNYNVAVREWNDQVIFLRKIVPGTADKSYGIQVARLAGLPAEIIGPGQRNSRSPRSERAVTRAATEKEKERGC